MITNMSTQPAWFYNEYQQVGTDFEDPGQVAAYDRNQGLTAESEQALVDQLSIRQGHTSTGLIALDFCFRGLFVKR